MHDGTDYSVSANTMTVDVTPVQDAPTAVDSTVITAEGTAHTFSLSDFNFSDVDGDNLAQVQITALESVGSLRLNGVDVTLDQVISAIDIAAGRLTFEPVGNDSGVGYDSFQFKVHDGIEFSTSPYTMVVDVNAINDPPTSSNSTVTTNEDTPFAFSVSDFNFSDVEGDSFTKVKITGLESNGTLKLSGVNVTADQEILVADIGNLVFTPAVNANGVGYDSFDFKVHDGTVYSDSAYTMTVDVTPVQDAPRAADNTVTTDEDSPYTFAEADFGFSDVV